MNSTETENFQACLNSWREERAELRAQIDSYEKKLDQLSMENRMVGDLIDCVTHAARLEQAALFDAIDSGANPGDAAYDSALQNFHKFVDCLSIYYRKVRGESWTMDGMGNVMVERINP